MRNNGKRINALRFIYKLAALDDVMKLPEENPAIGIIICKSKNRTRVEYALKASNKPIGAASYSFYNSLPDELRALLPSSAEIATIIAEIDEGDNEIV